MPTPITLMPDTPTPADTTVPARGWLEAAQGQITGTGGAITLALLGVAAGVLIAYLLQRRNTTPGTRKGEFSKHLMYVPLLLVNSAAIYGQVAFFYEKVAPPVWPIAGKVALSVLIAAAIESVAVYVGWHAHDALLMKASATAARLRRSSYGIAAFVGFINYWHFTTGYNVWAPTAASFAFGLLSLISPWLWGLHTRRAQHMQLTREGAIDQTGATFSGERIRLFPYRAYMARRWSVDHYVTDPQSAWEGYNAERAARLASGRLTRVRQAWLTLMGRAPNPGAGPVRVAVSYPGATPAIAPGVANGRSPGALEAAGPGNVPVAEPGRQHTANPGRKAPSVPARNRASNPGSRPGRKPSSAQVKAEKLRTQNPGMAVAEIARRVGANEKTVRVWFKALDPGSGDLKERASRPLPTLIFDPPKTPVLAGVNGNRVPPEENR